jgi:hypothetical protein
MDIKDIKSCPGSSKIKGTPEIAVRICPECGAEIELFSNDTHIKCQCGFTVYNETQNCIKWCAYARECVGDGIYEKFMQKN